MYRKKRDFDTVVESGLDSKSGDDDQSRDSDSGEDDSSEEESSASSSQDDDDNDAVDNLFAAGALTLTDDNSVDDDDEGDNTGDESSHGSESAEGSGGKDQSNNDSPSTTSSTRGPGGRPLRNRHEGRRSWPAGVDFYSSSSEDELNEDTNTILKTEQADSLDRLLSRADDPSFWNRVRDEMNQRDVVLSSRELDLLRAQQQQQFPMGYDPFEPAVETEYADGKLHPLSGRPEPKRRFLPSKWERDRIRRLVRGLARGVIKAPGQEAAEDQREKDENGNPRRQVYALWNDDDGADAAAAGPFMHVPAPKLPLPGHAASYNPPGEFLFSPDEEREWKEQDPGDRAISFIPRQYPSLRAVPKYEAGIRERFERCLDLYLCPRAVKKRQNVDPKDLLPSLPKPSELRPFPVQQAQTYKGHRGPVRSVAVDPTGQWLCSGSEDGTARVWEISSGRCVLVWAFGAVTGEEDSDADETDGPTAGDLGDEEENEMHEEKQATTVACVSWCPRAGVPVVALAVGSHVYFANAQVGGRLAVETASLMLQSSSSKNKGGSAAGIVWTKVKDAGLVEKGCVLGVNQGRPVRQLSWHKRGDYVASVAPGAASARAVLIHQLSSQTSQAPFKSVKGGSPEAAAFHPSKPLFFLGTQTMVRVYDLLKQTLVKKLVTNMRHVSSLAVHPGGDNVIVGSYDRRLSWFDMDLSTKPFRTLRFHREAVRAVRFHGRLPLFASCSDDGTTQIFHGTVYNDLLQNPLIVPVKILRGHQCVGGLGVLDCSFHPRQPWIFTGGVDKTIRLWVN